MSAWKKQPSDSESKSGFRSSSRARLSSLARIGFGLLAAILALGARAEESAAASQECGLAFRTVRPHAVIALLGLSTSFMVLGESLTTPPPPLFEPTELKDQWSDQHLRLRDCMAFVPQRAFALFSSTASRSIWPGWGELFPGDTIGRCRINGSGVKDPACFYVRMNFRF